MMQTTMHSDDKKYEIVLRKDCYGVEVVMTFSTISQVSYLELLTSVRWVELLATMMFITISLDFTLQGLLMSYIEC